MAVKVDIKRLAVFIFSGLLKGCEGHKTHHFENRVTNQLRKTGKRKVVLCEPLPSTLQAFKIAQTPRQGWELTSLVHELFQQGRELSRESVQLSSGSRAQDRFNQVQLNKDLMIREHY